MAQLVVRNLETGIKNGLQRRAKRHGHSMEEEARNILRSAVLAESTTAVPLGRRFKDRFAGIGLDRMIPPMRGRKARAVGFGAGD